MQEQEPTTGGVNAVVGQTGGQGVAGPSGAQSDGEEDEADVSEEEEVRRLASGAVLLLRRNCVWVQPASSFKWHWRPPAC